MHNPGAVEHQAEHAKAKRGRRRVAVMMMAVARMVTMAFAGGGWVCQTNSQYRRKRRHARSLDQEFQW